MNEFTDSRAELSSLRDIKDVVVDTSVPRRERIRDYVAQIGNPYRYLDDGIVVEIGYTDTDVEPARQDLRLRKQYGSCIRKVVVVHAIPLTNVRF